MKRLLLPLLAAISFLHVVLKQIKWDWITRINADIVAVLALILVIILVLIIFLLVAWLAPTPEEQEAEERRIKQYKKQYKKEKLISYGHDMKGLEEKYREVKIYREED